MQVHGPLREAIAVQQQRGAIGFTISGKQGQRRAVYQGSDLGAVGEAKRGGVAGQPFCSGRGQAQGELPPHY